MDTEILSATSYFIKFNINGIIIVNLSDPGNSLTITSLKAKNTGPMANR